MTGSPLAKVSRLLFWVYVATVLGSGFWGLVGARLDFPILMQQQVGQLSAQGSANVLNQYRFLRGIEAGFGLFAVGYRKQIFTGGSTANRLFLCAMGLGMLGRVFGWLIDGRPRAIMLVFLFVELIAWACIVATTRPWRSSTRPFS